MVDRINRQLEVSDLSVKAVHQLRVDLRIAETLIWWVKSDENHELEAFYNQIKVAFMRYEKLRAYQVYKKLLVSMEHLEPVEIMERLIENVKNELAQVPVIRISLPVSFEHFNSQEKSDALLKLNDLRGLTKLLKKDSVFRELDEPLRKVCLMTIHQNYKSKRNVLKIEFLKIRLLLRSLD